MGNAFRKNLSILKLFNIMVITKTNLSTTFYFLYVYFPFSFIFDNFCFPRLNKKGIFL